jgi:hypothetical protein
MILDGAQGGCGHPKKRERKLTLDELPELAAVGASLVHVERRPVGCGAGRRKGARGQSSGSGTRALRLYRTFRAHNDRERKHETRNQRVQTALAWGVGTAGTRRAAFWRLHPSSPQSCRRGPSPAGGETEGRSGEPMCERRSPTTPQARSYPPRPSKSARPVSASLPLGPPETARRSFSGLPAAPPFLVGARRLGRTTPLVRSRENKGEWAEAHRRLAPLLQHVEDAGADRVLAESVVPTRHHGASRRRRSRRPRRPRGRGIAWACGASGGGGWASAQ